MNFQPAPGTSCSEVLNEAVSDQRAGRYSESLQKFEWFFEHSRNDAGMGGVRLSFALSYWLELASQYDPAMTAFIRLRDRTESLCRTAGDKFKPFHELSALNRHLGENERTTAIFLEIAKENEEAAATIFHVAEPYLVAQGLYKECGPFLEVDRTIATSIQALRMDKEFEKKFAGLERSPPPWAERHFRERMVRLVALLALNDRASDAEKVADHCLAELNSAEFQSELNAALLGDFPKTSETSFRKK